MKLHKLKDDDDELASLILRQVKITKIKTLFYL